MQAYFLAGVWAYHANQTKNIIEPDDVEEALNAASAIGDDRAKTISGLRGARFIHARYILAGHALVQERVNHRRSAARRYI